MKMANNRNAKRIRDATHNLDPSDRETYERYRREFFEDSEGKADGVYFDTNEIKPRRTVGVGFNMDQPGAVQQWNEAFKNPDGSIAVSFDEVYCGKRKLKDKEIDRLFDYSVRIREKELTRSYSRNTWNKLKPNERLAIESIYFNRPKLVRGGSDIQDFMRDYLRTSDVVYLKRAMAKILANLDGLGDRRHAEAAMLSSHECPIYSQPHEGQFPEHPHYSFSS